MLTFYGETTKSLEVTKVGNLGAVLTRSSDGNPDRWTARLASQIQGFQTTEKLEKNINIGLFSLKFHTLIALAFVLFVYNSPLNYIPSPFRFI